ncbi:hypothetical protein [Pseudanabaena yagii]|uniref:Uncharacterized protein n=1 Tax=Pseudanabaena yagii GIHE-NHR1 TaxID=2722753 RepID=A0ABX1LVA7_9CYAN|nr:hypothetical protein [Pseudanabaena yagii]NMF60064.1 hypothetical protein [Pseudanabaena yagii GIHE-NHR1]
MTCQCGSQKQSGAVDFINPVDIGVLCALFGLEGNLCRLLDVVPAAIKKVASLNPDLQNADQVFGDILKKVAKKGFEIVIDEITGQIDVSQFCAKNPPPLPDDITYQDVFQFIAELVPILNYFFTANDILQGNSTKILDKIVGFWLYQKWYENCECSPCPPDTPPPPPSPPKLFDKCPAGYTRERAANDFGIIKKNYLGQVILYNNVFVFETEFVVTELNGTKFVTPPIAGYADGQGFWTNSPSVEIIKETDTTDSYNTVNGVRVQKGTLPSYFIPPCTPIPLLLLLLSFALFFLMIRFVLITDVPIL